MIFNWKEWLTLLTLVGVFFGGLRWMYNRIKELIKFLEEYEENKKELDTNTQSIDFVSGKIDGLVMLLHDCFFICDHQGLCVLANEALCELFETTQEQMKGSGWTNFIIDTDRERAWKEWSSNISTGTKYISGSYTIKTGRTRTLKIIDYHAVVPRKEDGTVIVSVGCAKHSK